MIKQGSRLWHYLSPEMRRLAADGQLLIDDRKLHPNEQLSDYSYLVFHYFPHNYRALTQAQAETLVASLVGTMEDAVVETHARPAPNREK